MTSTKYSLYRIFVYVGIATLLILAFSGVRMHTVAPWSELPQWNPPGRDNAQKGLAEWGESDNPGAVAAEKKAESAFDTVRSHLGVLPHFTDRTVESGITFIGKMVPIVPERFQYDDTLAVLAADVDGDERIDLYFVSELGAGELWRNIGNGHFQNSTASSGVIDDGAVHTGAAFADLDNDGDADLAIATYGSGVKLYLNDGTGHFTDVSEKAGLSTVPGHISKVTFLDANNDGLLDILLTRVGNFTTSIRAPEGYFYASQSAGSIDQYPSRAEPPILMQNNGLTFTAVPATGAEIDFRDPLDARFASSTRGISLGDLNADGYTDVFAVSGFGGRAAYAANKTYLSDAAGAFIPSSFALGVEPRRLLEVKMPIDTDFNRIVTRSSRSSVLFDIDGDGDLDIVTSEADSRLALKECPACSESYGKDFWGSQVLVSDLAQKKTIHFLNIELVGTRSNRDGLGATIMVLAGGKTQTRYVTGKSGPLAQSRMPLYFGLGNAERVDSIEIRWPSGILQKIDGIKNINTTRIVKEP